MTSFADESQVVLAAILDQSQDCILLLSPDGDLEYMNKNARTALEIEEFEQVAGNPWVDLWPEDTRKTFTDSHAKALRGHRSRFEVFSPGKVAEPHWWDVVAAPVYDSTKNLVHVLVTMRDVTDYMNRRLNDQIRREEAEREAGFAETVAREMRHRLKNQLAVVGSVAKLLARHSETAAEMSEKFESKLMALARAQDLLTVHRDEPITAEEALSQVLGASGAGEAIEVLHVPDARLGDDAVQQLALILGELQTNSLKYGALRDEKGRITLSGEMQGRSLRLQWHEECGRDVPLPERVGSGLKLLERLGSTGDAKGQTEWHRSGLTTTFYLRTLPKGAIGTAA
ncbi:PAS domain-containing protein [Qipengyuania sp. 1NDH17]|uniref:histidine kinase n=1 Tax=Qipengyuania polymorpha TaxID=2867234 RepID=A0ABS7J2H7_9SPHN|nr:PAS domain-containing protein [Qipengyuania polymorpha]MBX7458289.1 PAS domain-containing protein [Qipengyuania polymorpha]